MAPPPTMEPKTRSAGRTKVALVVGAFALAAIFAANAPPSPLPLAEAKSVRGESAHTGGRGLTLRKRVHDVDFDVPAMEESKEGIVASDEAVGLKPVRPTVLPPGPTRPSRPGQQQQQVSAKFGTDSCVGSCDGNAGDCYCDNLCNQYGDCCDDACQVCACQVCNIQVGECSIPSLCLDGDGYCGTPPAPGSPTNLAAALLSDPQVGVELTWSAASSGGPATGFTVHRRPDAGSLAEIGQVSGGTTTTYDDVDTLQAGTYHYAVKATNDGGESGFSNEASVTVQGSTCQAQSGLELTTGFVCGGDRSCNDIETYGIMFDVDTEGSSLSVDAFDLNIEKDAPQVQVWARPGTHEGFEFNSSGWTQIGSTYFLDGKDSGSPTRLTLSESVPINGRHAFYFLQTDDDDIELQYDNSWTLDTIQASDDNLKIYVGTRKDDEDAFDPNRENQRGHGFSGTIIYTDLCDGSSPTSPTDPPSTSPSLQPSLSPSGSPSREHSEAPTKSEFPSVLPSPLPSVTPSSGPSAPPSGDPSLEPSLSSSSSPSSGQSVAPSKSALPSVRPSPSPSMNPSVEATPGPSTSPSDAPSVRPSSGPSSTPSAGPSSSPSSSPSVDPSTLPSVSPSASFVPSHQPSSSPSSAPSPTTPSPTTPSPTDCQDESGLELSTGFECGGGDFSCGDIETEGIMFDIDTEGSSLSVDAFDLNIEKDAPRVQVWARPGTHEGNEDSSSGWRQIGPTYTLNGQGDGEATRLTLSESVPVNGRHAFYFLQTDEDDIELQFDKSWTLNTVRASDDNLKIYAGTRKDDEAFDPTQENERGYGFSGTIIYTDLCSPTTSAQPSMAPSSTFPTPPTPPPSAAPTITPPPGLSPPPTGGTITYTPGDIANGIKEAGLLLSKGLRARMIAVAGTPVEYDNDLGQSTRDFHIMPDGAGIFQDPNNPDCYSYVSNSEVRSDQKLGGVGAIILCGADVIEYKWLLENTERNCGGGKTPHGTWLSGEEVGDGSIWEVHPFGDPIFNGLAYQETKMSYTTSGEEDFDKFESIAVDNRNPNFPVYYITVDSSDGELRRWKPNSTIVSEALVDNDHTAVLANVGTVDYLILSGGSSGGKYSWTTNKQDAINSAVAHYQNPEGIEFDDKSGKLFFTAKVLEALFILDIDSDTYERVIPGTDGHPDQIKLICSVTDDDESLLYFAEDGGDRGIHARTPDGSFYEIILGEDYSGDESSGVAFSPDKMYMYFAMQDHGTIFQIWRDDLRPFSGAFNQLSDTAKEALAAAQAASTAAKEPDTRNPDMLTPITVASDDFGNATIQPGFQTSMTTSNFDAISGEKDDVTQAVFSTRVGGRHRRPRPN